jgi:hypothetical protein
MSYAPEYYGGLPDPGEGLANVVVNCVDENGDPEADVVVEARILAVPPSETGRAYDGIKQSDTSDSEGVATLVLVRTGTYQIRRGETKNWVQVTVPDEETTTVSSIIGL